MPPAKCASLRILLRQDEEKRAYRPTSSIGTEAEAA